MPTVKDPARPALRSEYDVVIVGAGLAGLTTAYHLKQLQPRLSILVLERSGTAGGLTGNWIDHRFGADKKLQPPMHMIFGHKYLNLLNLVQEIGADVSELFPGFSIITSDGTRHRLEMNDWTAKHLPPPLHALGMFAKLRMPLRAKWDMFKLASAATYCADAVVRGHKEPALVPNTMSLESLETVLNVGQRARDFVESVTPSIYNLHPWYTSAPRMSTVLAGTMVTSRDSIKYRVFSKNYNAAFIDRFVEKLRAMGVEFAFDTEARRIDGDRSGSRAEAVWCRYTGPEADGAVRYVCGNCGAENHCVDRAFCSRCGLDTTLDKVRDGTIKRPAGGELWADPAANGCQRVACRRLVTAIYPHMIARLVPLDSPLRKHPYVRSCFSSRGNQTQLSIGRVYYRKAVTDERHITGMHNPTYSFNGSQSVLNVFGADDLGYHGGDVIDVLLDVGVIRDAHSHEDQVRRIVSDLQRIYPAADPRAVEHVSFANLYPGVLYLSEQPAITELHRFFDTSRTGAANWYVAGCHSGTIGIGMESAVQSAMAAVNCILGDMEVSETVKVEPYEINAGSYLFGQLGRALLRYKGLRRSARRMAGKTYSD